MLALLLVLPLGACGSARSEPQLAPADDRTLSTEPLTTAEDASQALAAAEQQLQQLGLTAEGHAEPPPLTKPDPGMEPPATGQPAAELSISRRCTIACQALASMSRAAERLCQLTGEDDDRCVSARARLTAAEELIYRICSSCV